MAILYRAAKFKSANTFEMAIWDPTTKFNSRQYFRLYGSNNASDIHQATVEGSNILPVACMQGYPMLRVQDVLTVFASPLLYSPCFYT